MSPTRQEFIFDSCVLIDYLDTDSSILTLFSKHVGKAHVAVDQLAEVEGLDESTCRRLGLTVVDPNTEQLVEAGERPSTLTFCDYLCLVLARDHGWTCVTNDTKLQSTCEEHGITVIRGLRPLIELVRLGQVPAEDARRIAAKIADVNSYVTSEVIGDFHHRVEEVIQARRDQRTGRKMGKRDQLREVDRKKKT